MRKAKLYRVLAGMCDARRTCEDRLARDVSNVLAAQWAIDHGIAARALTREYMPSGGGFDDGTTLMPDASTGELLVFRVSFHHMDDNGSYDGWTSHEVKVKASLAAEIDVSISGENRNEIKDHISECFQEALRTEIDV